MKAAVLSQYGWSTLSLWVVVASTMSILVPLSACWDTGCLRGFVDEELTACQVLTLLDSAAENNCRISTESSCCSRSTRIVSADSGFSDVTATWDLTGPALNLTWLVSNSTEVSMMWNSSASEEAVYLICVSAMDGSCSPDCDSNASFYVTTGSSFSLAKSPAALTNSSIEVSAVLSNYSLSEPETARFRLGGVSGIAASEQFYDAAEGRPLLNVSWQHPADGLFGERMYNLKLGAAQLDVTVDNRVCNVSYTWTAFQRRVVQLPVLTLLQYGCTYALTITAVPTSNQQLAGPATSAQFTLERGVVNFPASADPCDDIALNASFQQAYVVEGRNLTVYWGLWGFEPALLPVPIANFLASLSYADFRVSVSIFEQFAEKRIDPFQYQTRNTSYRVTLPDIVGDFNVRSVVTFGIRLGFSTGTVTPFSVHCRSEVTLSPRLVMPTASPPSDAPRPTSPPAAAAPSPKSSPTAALAVALPIVAAMALGVLFLVMCLRFRRARKTTAKQLEYANRGYASGDSPGDSLEPDEYEVAPSSLTIFNVLGSGSFGVVLHAMLVTTDDKGDEVSVAVAVKTLLDSASESDRSDLLQEINHMKEFSHHPHIVKLLGCCTMADPIYLIAEWVPFGNLKELLRHTYMKIKEGSEVKAQKDERPILALDGNCLNATELYGFAHQIADGMEHLAQMRYVHRDLATRNILVGVGKQLKVADFGMTRDVYDESAQIYVKQGHGRVPIRWMATESLIMRAYTTQSDVWSYGVVLWELGTFAALPYSEMKNNELVQFLKSGGRLAKPSGCTDDIFNLMHACWSEMPDERPSFTAILQILSELLFPLVASTASSPQVSSDAGSQCHYALPHDLPCSLHPQHRHAGGSAAWESEEEFPYVDVGARDPDDDTSSNCSPETGDCPRGNRKSADVCVGTTDRPKEETFTARDASEMDPTLRHPLPSLHSPSLSSSGSSFSSGSPSSDSTGNSGDPAYLKVY